MSSPRRGVISRGKGTSESKARNVGGRRVGKSLVIVPADLRGRRGGRSGGRHWKKRGKREVKYGKATEVRRN
jgi:hypothetical protein